MIEPGVGGACSRRVFLGTSCAWLTAALARARSAPPRLGVRSPFPNDDLASRARLVRALGYDGIELGPEYLDRSADEIREALAGTGLAVSAIVGSLHLLDPDPAVRARAVELDRARKATDNAEAALARALAYVKRQWAEA